VSNTAARVKKWYDFEMGASAELTFVPRDRHLLARFGGGDERKLKAHLLMLAAFLEGKPENTKRTYRTAIRQFFQLFDWICPEDVTLAHAVAFKKHLLEHVGDATAYYRLSAMSSYFDFLRKPAGAVADPLLKYNPFDSVPRSDIKPTPYGRAVPMEWKTFKTILDSLPTDPAGIRDRAILLFFAFTGRRRSEVASLLMKDLDLKSDPKTYRCRVKGGALKHFELPAICYDALKAYWIASGRLATLHPAAGVFTSLRDHSLTEGCDPDRPLSTRMMNKLLVRAAKRANVDLSSVRLHGLRHMAAKDLDRAGARLQDIQEFLGHMTPNTTAIYLQKISGPTKTHEDKLMKVREAAEEMARNLSTPT
jgi:integrase